MNAFALRQPRSNPALRLCCFPYAGGDSRIYRTWQSLLPSAVEVLPFEYPGHGTRLREPLVERLPVLMQDVERALTPFLDRPLLLFGCSLGALVAFEAARRLTRNPRARVERLIVAACPSPPLVRHTEVLHSADPTTFFRAIDRRYGGAFPALREPELQAFYWPVFKADFSIFESYSFESGPTLECSVDAFAGLDDATVRREDVSAWSTLTRGPCHLRLFPGRHFFIHTAEAALLRELARLVLESEHAVRGAHEQSAAAQ